MYQASIANYPLPSILLNQDEKLASARKSAADGYLSSYTIPLLAEPETLVQTAKLNWVLRFLLPPPNPHSTRRFSATPSYNHGPRTPQALDGAIRFASSFTYDTPPVPSPLTSSFLQLPDPVSRFGAVRRPTAGPFPPPPQDIQDWLNAGAIRLHTHDEYKLPGANLQGLPPSIEKYFFGQISLDQLIALLDNAPTDASALQHADQDFRSSKRARIDLASIPRQPAPHPPPPLSPPPSSPTAPSPPPPLPFSPSSPVPPPFPTGSAPTYVVPDFPGTTPDPTPRSRTPRREFDSLLPTLDALDRPPPWNPSPGVEPVGAPGTTPLRPPIRGHSTGIFSSQHIRDFNPPDSDQGNGKGKGKAFDKGKGKGKKGHGKGKGKDKGKEGKNVPPPAVFAPPARGKGHE